MKLDNYLCMYKQVSILFNTSAGTQRRSDSIWRPGTRCNPLLAPPHDGAPCPSLATSLQERKHAIGLVKKNINHCMGSAAYAKIRLGLMVWFTVLPVCDLSQKDYVA